MQKAIIDLSKNGIIPVFHAKQGDTSRRVAITLLDNGLPYDTAADAVSVWYSGPSGEGNYSDGIEKDGSTLTILVNPNMTAASGRHTCAVMLSNESGRCTTWNFCVEVAYTPALGSEEAKAYFEAFEAGELAADIAAVDARTAKAVAELNARVSAIIASGTATEGNTELIDIRTGADGKVYQTAGDAVRGQIGELKDDLVNCTEYYNQIESPISYGFNSFVKVEWEQGSLYNGNNLSRTYAVRTKEKQKYGTSIIKLTKTLDSDQYRLFYAEYDESGVYIDNSTYYYGSSNYLTLNPEHYYRFVITTKDNIDLSPSDVFGKMHFVYADNIYTDNSTEALNKANQALSDSSYSKDASIINALNRTVGSFDGGCVVFTCDDGQLQDYEYLYPIIREFNVPFVFGMWSNCPMITSKLNDVKDMIENYGCEVAQHGITMWTDYTDYLNLYNSLKNEKQSFSDNGIIVKNAIYPYNDYNDVVKKACSGLYEYACCGGYHVNSWRNPSLAVERVWLVKNVNYQSDIDFAISKNRLLVFGIHSKEMESDSEVITTVRNAIEYAKTRQIPIKTLNTLNTYY